MFSDVVIKIQVDVIIFCVNIQLVKAVLVSLKEKRFDSESLVSFDSTYLDRITKE